MYIIRYLNYLVDEISWVLQGLRKELAKALFPSYRLACLGHAVVVVVGVCVCLLLVVLGVGVLRLRAANRQAAADEAEVEMAWDDTALNITVNPLEVQLSQWK